MPNRKPHTKFCTNSLHKTPHKSTHTKACTIPHTKSLHKAPHIFPAQNPTQIFIENLTQISCTNSCTNCPHKTPCKLPVQILHKFPTENSKQNPAQIPTQSMHKTPHKCFILIGCLPITPLQMLNFHQLRHEKVGLIFDKCQRVPSILSQNIAGPHLNHYADFSEPAKVVLKFFVNLLLKTFRNYTKFIQNRIRRNYIFVACMCNSLKILSCPDYRGVVYDFAQAMHGLFNASSAVHNLNFQQIFHIF